MAWKGEKSPILSALVRQKQKLWRDQMKETRSLSPWRWMVPILKMRRFSCFLRLSLPLEMGEMAQTFISEIEWLAASKCRATDLYIISCPLLHTQFLRLRGLCSHDKMRPNLWKWEPFLSNVAIQHIYEILRFKKLSEISVWTFWNHLRPKSSNS